MVIVDVESGVVRMLVGEVFAVVEVTVGEVVSLSPGGGVVMDEVGVGLLEADISTNVFEVLDASEFELTAAAAQSKNSCANINGIFLEKISPIVCAGTARPNASCQLLQTQNILIR